MKKIKAYTNQLCDNCKKINLCPDHQENLKLLSEGFSISIVDCDIFENKNIEISVKSMQTAKS